MKNIAFLYIALFLLSFSALAGNRSEQSGNQEAVLWFNIGVKAKDYAKKIEAYRKAVAYDTEFTEALYNLGLAYRRSNDLANAERYLLQALKSHKGNYAVRLKVAILYEIAQIYKSTGRLQDCEEALRGGLGLANETRIRTAILMELAHLMLQQERYQDAIVELNKARSLPAANVQKITRLLQIAEAEQKSLQLYQAATAAESRGEYNAAKRLFEELRSIQPDYKDVNAKIALYDSILQAHSKQETQALLYSQAQRQADAGNAQAAIGLFQKLLDEAGDYKDAKQQLSALQTQLAENTQRQQIDSQYNEALAALKQRDWPRAISLLENVLVLDANHPDARRKLRRAKRGLEARKLETLLADYYRQGLMALRKGRNDNARSALKKVLDINPNYRDVQVLWQQINPDSPATNQQAAAELIALASLADSLFLAGQVYFENKQWQEAVDVLEKANIIANDDPEIAELLAGAKAKLTSLNAIAASTSDRNSKRMLHVIATAFLLIGLPALGFVASPTMRAKYYMFRGNVLAAAQVYEKLLSKNPGRLRLYCLLANIYLATGRKDEQALKIFKMVSQLKLNTHDREKIDTVLAEHQLLQPKSSANPIDMLEQALLQDRQKR